MEVFYKKVALQITKRFVCICGKYRCIINAREFVFNKVQAKAVYDVTKQ